MVMSLSSIALRGFPLEEPLTKPVDDKLTSCGLQAINPFATGHQAIQLLIVNMIVFPPLI
jgi:hypothetical protein